MALDDLEYKANLLHQDSLGEWCRDNVWYPMVAGSGVVQVYNNFVSKPVEVPTVHAQTGSREWVVQTLSSVTGAIIPYAVAGKVMGYGMRSLGDKMAVQGMSARFLASESAAMILGAGAYDFIKKPHEGETRLGNAAGSMAAFLAFEQGNKLLEKVTPAISSTVGKVAWQSVGRIGVGAVGGLASYETSSYVSGLLGEKDQRNWDNRLNTMVTSGFINFGLPVAKRGLDIAVRQLSGEGEPSVNRVEQHLRKNKIDDPELKQLARENPLAKVKEAGPDGQTLSHLDTNTVEVRTGESPARLGHELKHLRLAREFEPRYKEVAKLVGTDPVRAEAEFYKLRADIEASARQTENNVRVRTSGSQQTIDRAIALGTETATNGRTYAEIWKEQWQSFKQNPSSRPKVEFSGSVPELGATVKADGIDFAVHSKGASKVELLIFADKNATEPSKVITMDRTGDTWHKFVPELKDGTLYLYRAEGPYTPQADGSRFNGNKVLIDPYSKAVTGDTKLETSLGYDNSNPNDPARHLRPSDVKNAADMPKSVAVKAEFDWKGDKPLNIPMSDTVVYEMSLRGFTADAAELGSMRGTYRGLVEKIPYLQKLGVTAVELLPIMEFDKIEGPLKDPTTGKQLGNAWGYNTVAFQAPESRFAADGTHGQQVTEFKSMVKALHDAKIEVILDIVFNHTRESDQHGPTVNFRGLDNQTYYMLKPGQPDLYVDHTGCGNTVNTNHPVVQKFILDTLRYWHKEMHVDGFRFDLASVFNYDVDGVEKAKTPIIKAIESDPVLKNAKLIAEPWSVSNYRLGIFSDTRWSEWNGNYRDTVRRFIRGEAGTVGTLGDRIVGSPGWYDAKEGRRSINFITAHDGFTMNDLVSYDKKHNIPNGEGNRDGSNDNFSWNHGVEGPVEGANLSAADKAAIEALRVKQIKNMMAMNMLSQGTPMLLSGDEVRRTQNGNNNAWSNETLNNFDWSAVEKNADTLRFTQMMIELRKTHEIGRLTPGDVVWHGTEPLKPDWGDHTRFIAWQNKPTASNPKSLFQAFNAFWEPIKVTLPEGNWARLVDTSLPSGQDIVASGKGVQIARTYTIAPRSSIVLEAVPGK